MTHDDWRLLESLYETRKVVDLSAAGKETLCKLYDATTDEPTHPEWYSEGCGCKECTPTRKSTTDRQGKTWLVMAITILLSIGAITTMNFLLVNPTNKKAITRAAEYTATEHGLTDHSLDEYSFAELPTMVTKDGIRISVLKR